MPKIPTICTRCHRNWNGNDHTKCTPPCFGPTESRFTEDDAKFLRDLQKYIAIVKWHPTNIRLVGEIATKIEEELTLHLRTKNVRNA